MAMGSNSIEQIIFNSLKEVDADETPEDVLAALAAVLIGISLDYGIEKPQFMQAVGNQWDKMVAIFRKHEGSEH